MLGASLKKRYVFGLLGITFPWFVVFLLRGVGPIQYSVLHSDLELFLAVFLFLVLFFYCLGFVCVKSNQPVNNCVAEWNEKSRVFRSTYRCLVLLGVAYPALAFFDFFVVQGGSIFRIVAMREEANVLGPRGSLVGALIALMSAAPPLLFALSLSVSDLSLYKRRRNYLVVLMGFLAMFLSGGRNSFFIGLCFILMFYLFFVQHSAAKEVVRRADRFRRFLLVILIVFGFVYSMQLFVARFEVRGVEVDGIIGHLELNNNLSVSRLETDSLFMQTLYVIYVYLVFYVTHSLNYINQYFEFTYSPFAKGAYTFPQVARLLDAMLGSSYFDDAQSSLLTVGAYLSLPGSLYVDFGLTGTLVVIGVLAFIYGYLIRNIDSLALYQKVILSYLSVVVLFAPIYSVFGIANGFSLMFLCCLLILGSLRFRGLKRNSLNCA